MRNHPSNSMLLQMFHLWFCIVKILNHHLDLMLGIMEIIRETILMKLGTGQQVLIQTAQVMQE